MTFTLHDDVTTTFWIDVKNGQNIPSVSRLTASGISLVGLPNSGQSPHNSSIQPGSEREHRPHQLMRRMEARSDSSEHRAGADPGLKTFENFCWAVSDVEIYVGRERFNRIPSSTFSSGSSEAWSSIRGKFRRRIYNFPYTPGPDTFPS